MEEAKKSNEEMLAEVYRNCQIALDSISDILPETQEGKTKDEILRQHEEYEKLCARAAAIAKESNIELKEPNPVKKAMMWSAIKMNTLADNSDSHIAELMLEGTVTGIKCLRTSYSDAKEDLSPEVDSLVREAIAAEESFEANFKSLL
ncbi:MAG: hypothetical protein ACI4U2_03780 [Christensenellaceae bacterium]